MFDQFLEQLRAWRFSPDLIFDIGAYEGAFIDSCKRYFPDAAYWAFEPNQEKQELLQGKANRVFTDVLAASSREITYWESTIPVQTGNSIFRENTNIGFRPTTRTSATVDSLAAGHVPTLAKLDTQGSELEILKGGIHTLCRADLLIIETSIRRYNKGAPLFAELHAFLEAQNFALMDMWDSLRINGILVQSDMVFINKTVPYFTEDISVRFQNQSS
jgi:FkbM family methyltransferase